MAVWNRFGWLGYAIIFGTFFGCMAVFDRVFGNGFVREYPYVLSVCTFVISSALCWPVGRRLNHHLPIRLFDADAAWKGRSTAHSTFYVRLEFAGLVGIPFHILVALGGLDALNRK